MLLVLRDQHRDPRDHRGLPWPQLRHCHPDFLHFEEKFWRKIQLFRLERFSFCVSDSVFFLLSVVRRCPVDLIPRPR